MIREDWLLIKRKVAEIKMEADHRKISPVIISMLILAEDQRFDRHPGVDLISIFRAAWRTLFCGRIEGASTISMQLVRVLTGHYERTLRRKFIEMYLAIRLANYVKKADIPKLYLFVAYFGWRMNGLVQASERMHIDLLTLSEYEAASLIARLKYPEPKKYHKVRLHKIRSRAIYILSQFYANKNISKTEYLHKGDNSGTL